jgi:hypothetical protein
MTLSGTLDATLINAEFTAWSTYGSNNQQGSNITLGRYGMGKIYGVPIDVIGISSATLSGARSKVFTASDDFMVCCLKIDHTDGGAAKTILMTVTCVDPITLSTVGLEEYNKALCAGIYGAVDLRTSLSSIIGNTTNRTSFGTTGFKPFLIKGLTYKIELSSSSAVASTQTNAALVLRQRRRLQR